MDFMTDLVSLTSCFFKFLFFIFILVGQIKYCELLLLFMVYDGLINSYISP